MFGVEPSSRMRAVARASARHERVTYLAGAADRIPLPDDSVDLVLMFLVLRGISTFEYLTEEETARGLAALDADVAAQTIPEPVEGDCDLLVLSRATRKA